MADELSQRFCLHCRDYVQVSRPKPNHVLHFLITAFTCGAWAIVWVLMSAFPSGGWRCQRCGGTFFGAPDATTGQ